jgi:hypothetical protein
MPFDLSLLVAKESKFSFPAPASLSSTTFSFLKLVDEASEPTAGLLPVDNSKLSLVRLKDFLCDPCRCKGENATGELADCEVGDLKDFNDIRDLK